MEVYHTTPEEFNSWLAKSRPQARKIYHEGYLPLDRVGVALMGPDEVPMEIVMEPVDTVATLAYQAYERGQVELVQEKLGPQRFRYIAVKRKSIRKDMR